MNNTRKLGAHLILLPDGSIGSWPIVEVAGNGTIVSVETNPQGMKERPGLEWFGGLMIPGLLDVAGTASADWYKQALLNTHFSEGTLYIGLQESARGFNKPPFFSKSPDSNLYKHPALVRTNLNFSVPLFRRISDFCLANTGSDWVELLWQASAGLASMSDDLKQYGSIQAGKQSGLLVISGADLKQIKPSNQMRIKWLSYPSDKK